MNVRSHLLSAQVVTKPQVTPSSQAKQSEDLGGGTVSLRLESRMGNWQESDPGSSRVLKQSKYLFSDLSSLVPS